MNEEKTIAACGIHWKNFILPMLTFCAFEVLLALRLRVMDAGVLELFGIRTPVPAFGSGSLRLLLSRMEVLLIAVMMLRSLEKMISLCFVRYVLTENKVIIRRGFLNKYENEMLIASLWNVQFKQSLYERLFNTGDLLLSSAAASFYLDDVKNVREFKALIEKQLFEKRKI